MSATNILINVGAQTARAVTNLQEVRTELGRVDTNAKKWGPSLKGATAAAAAGFAAVGAAALGVGAAMLDFGKAAYDDAKAAGNLADVLENIPGITQKMIDKNSEWIDSMELATNISDDEFRASIGRLAVATGDLTKAQELSALAADISIGRNMSLEAATKLLEKAYNGNTTSLQKQMPWLDKNKDGTISLDEATKGLTKAYGGAAKAAANRDPWERLNTIWGQLKEQLGQWLLPLIEKFGDWFKKPENQKKIQEFLERVGNLSRELGEKLVKALQDAYDWFKSPEGKQAIEDLKELVKDLSSALKTLAGWFETVNGWRWVFNLNPIIGLARTWERVKDAMQWVANNLGIGRRSGGGTFSLAPGAYSGVSQYGRTNTNTNVVQLYGSATETDARVIKRILEGYDVAQGRAPGQPLRTAW